MSATLVGMTTFMHHACMQSATHLIQSLIMVIQVSKFQNECMKSLFLPKYEPKIVRMPCIVAEYRKDILTKLGSYFGRIDDFINSF